jgi:hypothetical protein
MGGSKARVAAIAAALCGTLALAPTGSAAAEAPAGAPSPAAVEPIAAVVTGAAQDATSIANDATNSPVSQAVRDTVSQAASGRSGPDARTGAGLAAESLGHESPRQTVPPRPAAAPRERPGGRPAPSLPRRTRTAASPPHGRKAPATRSSKGRVAGPRSHERFRGGAVRVDRVPPNAPSLTGVARALWGTGGVPLAAFLIAPFAFAWPPLLRALRAPAPSMRRPAFVSPIVPPG